MGGRHLRPARVLTGNIADKVMWLSDMAETDFKGVDRMRMACNMGS